MIDRGKDAVCAREEEGRGVAEWAWKDARCVVVFASEALVGLRPKRDGQAIVFLVVLGCTKAHDVMRHMPYR